MAGSALSERLAASANRVFSQPPEVGALPLLRAATDPDIGPADYFGPGGFARLHGRPERERFSRRARDPQVGRALWQTSERLTGVVFDWSTVAEVSAQQSPQSRARNPTARRTRRRGPPTPRGCRAR